MRVCAIVPSFNHHTCLATVLVGVREHVDGLLVVDDGSEPAAADAIRAIGEAEGAEVVRRPLNGGKGAAVRTGLERARELGFTHALQVDADGQHDLSGVAQMIDAARSQANALVLGSPMFDASAPFGRRLARRICQFWVNVETRGRVIDDPMCGFRVYPVDAALRVADAGNRMEFDPEIAVRMRWAGAPVVNVPVAVRYPENGTSNFRLLEDNLRISWMHTRLMTALVMRTVRGWFRP